MENKNTQTKLILKNEQAPYFISFYTNAKDSFSYFVFIYVLFFDLKYKEDAFIFMLFYFVFLSFVWEEKKTVLKECRSKRKPPLCIHWLFICVLCCYFQWIYFILLMRRPL